MRRTSIDEKATVTVNINGKAAKETIKQLQNEATDLRKRLKEAQEVGDKQQIKKLINELKRTDKALDQLKSQTVQVEKVMKNLDRATPNELRKTLNTLRRQLNGIERGSAAWTAHVAKIRAVQNEISKVNASMAATQSVGERISSMFGGWGMLLSGAGLMAGARKAVDVYADMQQEMANVQKYTGMTAGEVGALNEEFKSLDTRTSREGLNMLAQEAGRLGKTSQEDVMGFVRAADQINVALDDLGDGATLTISKLTGVFGDEARYGTEQSLLKVGSVINELSQNCSASAPYLAEFASRMGAVGAQAGMTISQVMAFGAVLDTQKINVEASSTALSKVIVRLMQQPAKYAKVAGLDVKQFSEMLKTDANGALILFLETLNKAGGMDVLSPMFKDMGENGSGAITALSSLATHIEEVKKQQIEASKAFEEGISVSNEFAVQNNTDKAIMEKNMKVMKEKVVSLGQSLFPIINMVTTSGTVAMGVLAELVKFVIQNKDAIIALASAVMVYQIALKKATIETAIHAMETKLLTMAHTAQRAATLLSSGALALLTGNTTRAAAAYKLFCQTLKVSPLGLVAAGVTAVVGALIVFRSRTDEATEAKKALNDIEKTAIERMQEEKSKVDLLIAAAKDETLSLNQRLTAVNELNAIIPDYNAQIDATTGKYKASEKALNKYNQALQRKYELEGAKEMLADLGKQKAKAVIEEVEAEKDLDDFKKYLAAKPLPSERISVTTTGSGSASAFEQMTDSSNLSVLKDKVEAAKGKVGTIDAKLTAITNKYWADLKAQAVAPETTETGTEEVKRPGYVSQTQADKERKKVEAEARRAAAKARKEFKAQMDAYKAMRSEADREALEQYQDGTIDYKTLMERRFENESDYYDHSIAFFEKTFADQKESYLRDDKDYQKLLLDKEKAGEAYESKRIALELETINRRAAAQEQSAQHMYDVRAEKSINDEIELQAKLHAIRRQALDEQLALYKAGSKEYADTEFEIQKLEQARELTEKKLYFKAVDALRKEYDHKSAAEKFTLEKATLDALLKSNYITAEQYARFLKGLTAKYKQELPAASSSPWSEADQKAFEEHSDALKKALESELLTKEDYNDRMNNLDKERRDKMLAGLKETGGEWNSMMVNIYSSIATLIEGLDGSLNSTLGNVAGCVEAVSAAVNAGMQIATDFAKAEAEIQLKAVEERYDREISLAEGNSYKVARLEKEKEKETAKVKNEASRKQYDMQIVQAIAQAITAGLNAYASTLAIPVIGPALAPAAMAVALAMGTAQVALLKKQQQAAAAQGYAEGGFTRPGGKYEEAGVVHAGEWVASQKLVNSPVARPIINALEFAQRNNKIASLSMSDVSRRLSAPMAIVAESSRRESTPVLVTQQAAAPARELRMLAEAANRMTDRLSQPFQTINTVAGEHGIESAEEKYQRLINNKKPKTSR